jgi:hypothetical protein
VFENYVALAENEVGQISIICWLEESQQLLDAQRETKYAQAAYRVHLNSKCAGVLK